MSYHFVVNFCVCSACLKIILWSIWFSIIFMFICWIPSGLNIRNTFVSKKKRFMKTLKVTKSLKDQGFILSSMTFWSLHNLNLLKLVNFIYTLYTQKEWFTIVMLELPFCHRTISLLKLCLPHSNRQRANYSMLIDVYKRVTHQNFSSV